MEKKSAVEADKLGGFHMAYQKFTGTYQSSDHINRIHYYIYEPETDLRAIIQIVHDFGDRIERNESFIRFFTDHGIMVCGCDHIGHGRSSKKEDYGYFGEKNGWAYLIKNNTLHEKGISGCSVFYIWAWHGFADRPNGLYS